ncbi:MAG TPA: GNAT family N-acetyltransferase [Firmicutes bacterium]|nr:GNAT family N-acetyltransferase [Bacillota bacterium]
MIPTYINETWDYSIEKFCQVSEMCFPDENYQYEKMAENSIFIGAYDGNRCIGLAILQRAFFKYMYLYDLKVNNSYRKMGVAKALIEKAKMVAQENGYCGIYTQGQDNNLGACLFYLKTGFVIGGLDTKVYQGTPQEGKKDIYFYLDF